MNFLKNLGFAIIAQMSHNGPNYACKRVLAPLDPDFKKFNSIFRLYEICALLGDICSVEGVVSKVQKFSVKLSQ